MCLFGELTEDLLTAICRFTPYRCERLLAEHDGRDALAMTHYLSAGLGPGTARVTIEPGQVEALLDLTRTAGRILAEHLDEGEDPLSSAENVLLALPLMEQPPATGDEVAALVHAYVHGVRRAVEHADA